MNRAQANATDAVPGADSIVVDDPRLLACIEAGEPDIGTLWEVCMQFEFERERTADSIAAWLGPAAGLRVLDCACGSGFPAIELARRGYDMTCTDGSAMMLAHFKRNAQTAGVSLEPELLLWEELPERYGGQFDVVINRGGGNYKYAGAWETDRLPDRSAMGESIRQWVACLRPGGRFYVDMAPVEDAGETGPWSTTHPTLLIGDHRVDVTEEVTTDTVLAVRTWQSRLTIDGTSYEFRRRSHRIEEAELLDILRGAGLTDVRKIDIPYEFYDVFTGVRADPVRGAR